MYDLLNTPPSYLYTHAKYIYVEGNACYKVEIDKDVYYGF